jgi:hypothetical protein
MTPFADAVLLGDLSGDRLGRSAVVGGVLVLRARCRCCGPGLGKSGGTLGWRRKVSSYLILASSYYMRTPLMVEGHSSSSDSAGSRSAGIVPRSDSCVLSGHQFEDEKRLTASF